MNGQFLMNKEISVQYAYKKDGKGERHGDEAERKLAAQARKHNVQPVTQPIPPQFITGPVAMPPPMPPTMTPAMTSAMNLNIMDAHTSRGTPPISTPLMNGSFANVPPPVPNIPMNAPTPNPGRVMPPSGPPFVAPPGLPARPPPSQAGYGGPPQGFVGVPPGLGRAPPPPVGFSQAMGLPGGPPPLPPGFQQPGYGRGL